MGQVGPFKLYATGDTVGLDSESREKTLTPDECIRLADFLRGWAKAAKSFAKVRTGA
jgi:hypothetical protein